jgi:hypothetical protein
MSFRGESGVAFHAEQFFERRPRTASIRFIGVLSSERALTSMRNRDAYDAGLFSLIPMTGMTTRLPAPQCMPLLESRWAPSNPSDSKESRSLRTDAKRWSPRWPVALTTRQGVSNPKGSNRRQMKIPWKIKLDSEISVRKDYGQRRQENQNEPRSEN